MIQKSFVRDNTVVENQANNFLCYRDFYKFIVLFEINHKLY